MIKAKSPTGKVNHVGVREPRYGEPGSEYCVSTPSRPHELVRVNIALSAGYPSRKYNLKRVDYIDQTSVGFWALCGQIMYLGEQSCEAGVYVLWSTKDKTGRNSAEYKIHEIHVLHLHYDGDVTEVYNTQINTGKGREATERSWGGVYAAIENVHRLADAFDMRKES